MGVFRTPTLPYSAEVRSVLPKVSREDERGNPKLPQETEVDLPEMRQGSHAEPEGDSLTGSYSYS